MKRIITIIPLALCLLVEGFITLVFLAARLADYDSAADMGQAAQDSICFCFFLGALTSVWGIIATILKRRYVLGSVTLCKMAVAMLFIGLLFWLDPPTDKDTGLLFFAFALFFGWLGFYVAWKGNGHQLPFRKKNLPDAPPVPDTLTSVLDKAEYHRALAAKEYLEMTGKSMETLTAGDQQQIGFYAGVPIAYFLTWLIRRDLVSDAFRQKINVPDRYDFLHKTADPLAFLGKMPGQALYRTDLAQEVLAFADWYYSKDGDPAVFQLAAPRFRFDYWAAVRNPEKRWYTVDFTWDGYDALEPVLDTRYRRFRADREPDQPGEYIKDVYLPLFDVRVRVTASPHVTDAYVEQCIGHMQSQEMLLLDGCQLLAEGEREGLTGHFIPEELRIFQPYDIESAYFLHGRTSHAEPFTLCIRGSYVLFAAMQEDAEHIPAPWGGAGDRAYSIRCAENYERIVQLTDRDETERLAGKGSLVRTTLPDGEQVYVLPCIAAMQAECACTIEAMQILGEAETYVCRAQFERNNPVPRGLLIESRQGSRKVFTEWLVMY